MKNLLLATCCALTFAGNAQLTISPISSPQAMINYLQGYGLTISNMTLTNPQSMGFFSGTSNMAFGSGVALTTGSANDIPNAEPYFASTANNTAGDTDLTALSGLSTNDASVIEFDCVPTYGHLEFDFAFGSEEYPTFYCNFNDIFAIYVSGLDTNGSSYVKRNIALVPGTNTPVSINTVFDTAGYGGVSTNGCPLLNPTQFVNNAGGTTVAYGGFTHGFNALLPVVPGTNYHFKIAIADAGDAIYDSGVMFLTNSFRSIDQTMGAKNSSTPQVNLYPNPAKDNVRVTCLGKVEKCEIYNSLGAMIKVSTSGSIDVSSLNNGIYFIHVYSTDGKSVKTFIKE